MGLRPYPRRSGGDRGRNVPLGGRTEPYAQGWVTSSLLDMQLEAGYQPFDYDTGAEVVDKSNVEAVTKREARFG